MDSCKIIKQCLEALPTSLFHEAPEHSARAQTVRWVKVINFPNKNLQLGLSESGYWVREGVGDVCVLDPAQGLVPLYPCLEIEPSVFHQKLAMSLNKIGLRSDVAKTFPLVDLIGQALHSGSEHWTKLGLQWCGTATKTTAITNALAFVAHSKDKRLSLNTRQAARHFLKDIEKTR